MNISNLNNTMSTHVLQQLPSVIESFQINTPLRVSHFLAQCAHESGNFRFIRENLNYSVDGLLKTFPRHFKNVEEAQTYARRPEYIASKIYANRIGNGPESSGDGWLYRGRGYIQLTGRANYRAFDNFVSDDIMANPDLVATKYPLLSAAWFWHTRNLNVIADAGSSQDVIIRITRVVNGGLNGLVDRVAKFKKYYSTFET
jgi:putative chitinase